MPATSYRAPSHPFTQVFPSAFPSVFTPAEPSFDGEAAEPGAVAGTVRTMCVRLCDGYYFPISYAAPRSRLSRDADACSASCGKEARLFFYANPGSRLEDMVDMGGMAYASLANAYRYRTALVQGCRCRPPTRDATEPCDGGPCSPVPPQPLARSRTSP